APSRRPREGSVAGHRPGVPHDQRPVPHLRLARTGNDGDVRDPVRRPSAPGPAPARRAVRGVPSPEGLPLDVPRGQTVAGGSRGRGSRGRRVIGDSSIFDTAVGGYWIPLVLKAAAVLGVFLVVPLAVGYMEHKVLAHMQARMGPMEAGMFHGWAQLMADGAKFIQKEDIVPEAADRTVFSLAPGVALVPYLIVLVVIPFGADLYALDLDIGIFFVLAMSSIGVLGVLMAGWSSANKFSLMGALRAAAQLIAYELPLVLAAAAAVMLAGTLSLLEIVEAQ